MQERKENNMAELKPCRRCYKETTYVVNEKGKFYVHCWTCHASGPEEETGQQAIDAWNKRV